MTLAGAAANMVWAYRVRTGADPGTTESMPTAPPASPDRSGNWATRGAVAAGRGIALVGLTVAGLVLWVVFATAVTLAPLGIGLSAISATVRAMRRLETRVWLLTLTPVGLIAWGLFGVVMPAVWHPIVTAHGNNWYAFIHVTTASTAWLSAALGTTFIALGLLAGPWLLRRYGTLAQSLLAPIRTA